MVESLSKHRWTEEEINILIKFYPIKGGQYVADVLGLSLQAITSKAKRLKIHILPETRLDIMLKVGEKAKEKGTQAKENNPRWRGGISKNYSHYRNLQKERYPEKIVARKITYLAIRKGTLVRQPCEICDSDVDIAAHHDDYSKPLEVRWLCRKCHHKWHMENTPNYTGYKNNLRTNK